MVFNRVVALGAFGFFAGSILLQLASAHTAFAATEPDVGMTPGTVLVQDVPEDKILVGMISSFATDNLAGSATMHPRDKLKPGKTTVLNGKGDIDGSHLI